MCISYIKPKVGVNVCGFRSINRTIQAWDCYYKYICEIWETNKCEAASLGLSVYERNKYMTLTFLEFVFILWKS